MKICFLKGIDFFIKRGERLVILSDIVKEIPKKFKSYLIDVSSRFFFLNLKDVRDQITD